MTLLCPRLETSGVLRYDSTVLHVVTAVSTAPVASNVSSAFQKEAAGAYGIPATTHSDPHVHICEHMKFQQLVPSNISQVTLFMRNILTSSIKYTRTFATRMKFSFSIMLTCLFKYIFQRKRPNTFHTMFLFGFAVLFYLLYKEHLSGHSASRRHVAVSTY
jgi:hypothetical protein